MDGVAFGDLWHYVWRRPIEPISGRTARRRHAAGKPYAAKLPGGRAIEVCGSEYVVLFLDERGRAYLKHWFEPVDGQLFLTQAVLYTFRADDEVGSPGRAPVVDTFNWKPDGSVKHRLRDVNEPRGTRVTQAKEDVSMLWEPVPAFGDWDSITRLER